jgi:kynurenine 3-monooxygenase
MVTIRCSPWSFEDRVVLIGDAAHAVFPSYGQGANAGFEDCATLDDCLERTGGDWGEAFGAFEERRREDVNAIADLSKQHLIELCAALGSPERTLRDSLERKLNRMYRRQYLPLYSMVAFTDMPYAEAVRIDRDRQPLLERLTTVVGDRDDLDDPDVERLIDRTMQTAGVLSAKGRI